MESRVLFAERSATAELARALDSDIRRRMLDILSLRRLNIGQLAEELGIPQSTCTVNLQILRRAGLVGIESVSARKGAQKLCSALYDELVLPLGSGAVSETEKFIETEMPIGLYTDFQVLPPCGLVSHTGIIGYYDQTDSFLNPHRAGASLIWFSQGWLEYRFPKNVPGKRQIVGLSLTAELGSEFPGFKTDWPSDLTLWINGLEVGTWTCPGDMGGERGRHTPPWWDVNSSQYGFLKTWRVAAEGSYIDGVPCSERSLADLDLASRDSYLVRLGVKADAEHCGGLNLFGSNFGNYKHGLVLRIELGDPVP